MSSKESDLSEKERELIDKVAKRVVNQGLEAPAIMLLQTFKPMSIISGNLALFYLAPVLPMLEEKGYDFIETFEKRENIEKLIKRMERLNKEKSKEDKKNKAPSFWSRLRMKFSNRGKIYKQFLGIIIKQAHDV